MSDAMLWNEIGNIYLKLGSLEEAVVAYTKASELNPRSGWPYYNLANAHYQSNDYGRALQLYRKSIQLMDTAADKAMVWNKIGDTYRALRDTDNAVAAYKKADELDLGASRQAAMGRHTGSSNHVSFENARPRGEEPLPPQRRTRLENEGALMVDFEMDGAVEKGTSGKPLPSREGEHTIPSEQPLMSFDIPVDDQNVSDEGTLAIDLDQYAFMAPKTVQTDKPTSNKAHSIYVIPDPEGKKPDVKFERNRQTENENRTGNGKGHPENPNQDQVKQATIYAGVENLEEILAKVNIYENITRVNPTNDRAWDTLGKLYKSLGRYQDAIRTYLKAIEICPDKEVYYYYLGLLYSVLQQHENAVRAFQYVLRKNPDYVLAHSAIAGVYHRMGLENKANHHIATALPKMNNESAYNRACFYAICGDNELAFEFLRLALANKDTTIEWIKSDPDLDPIRNDPRYIELISGKEAQALKSQDENYFASEMNGKKNRLLSALNQSLSR